MTKFKKIVMTLVTLAMGVFSPISFSQTLVNKYIDNSAEITKFNNACKKIQPYLNIQVGKMGEIAVDNSVMASSITAYDTSFKALPPNSITWGITEATYAIEMEYKVQTLAAPSLGVMCAIPGIDILVRFQSLNIKIAKELGFGTCAYNYVLMHEMEHVNIYKQNIAIMRNNLMAVIEKKLKDKIFVGSNKDVLVYQAGEFIQSFIHSELNTERDKIRALQAKLDTPEEYGKASHVCGGALSKARM